MEKETESKESPKAPKRNLMKKITTQNIVIVLALIIFFALGYSINFALTGMAVTKTGAALTADEAANKAIDYLNNNIFQPGVTADIINVTETSGVYEVWMTITSSQGSSVASIYVTEDGKMMFISVIPMEEPEPEPGPTGPAEPCEAVVKTERPLLQAFVVSYCPYGLQMLRILVPVAELLGDYADIEVRYIGSVVDGQVTAMHGETEATENLRQICIREEQGDKFWNYISCFIKTGNFTPCLAEANINATELEGCMSDPTRGIEYAEEDFQLQRIYSVSGSPTLILNGQRVSEFDFGGRTAEAVKTLLCCGFSTEPDACLQTLSEEQATAGISQTYSGGSSSGGTC